MNKTPFYFVQSILLFAVVLFSASSIQAGFLYVLNDVDEAGNYIYAYSVDETTGALTALSGFPIATGGNGDYSPCNERLTIDRTNNRLYAVNSGSDTISAYSMNPDTGALTPMPFSPIVLQRRSQWCSIAVHPSGSPLIVSNLNSQSQSYNITATTATAATDVPTITHNVFNTAFSRDGKYFYTGGNSDSGFGGYSVDVATGVITPLPGSPYTDAGGATALTTDSTGRIFTIDIFEANFTSVLRAFTTASGVPSPVSGNPFASGLTTGVDGALHPNGNFYVIADRGSFQGGGNQVGSFQIAGSGSATTLTAAPGSPASSGGTFTNTVVFNAAGNFLYASNGTSRNVTTYSFNPSTGAIANINVQTAGSIGASGELKGMDYYGAAPVATEADLAVSMTASPDPLAPGADLTYQMTLTNKGGTTAENVVLTQSDFFRQRGGTRLTLSSISAPAGWTCEAANPIFAPSFAEIVCRGASLGAGQTAQFTIVKRQQRPLPRGIVIYHEALVSSNATETNTENNRATDTTTVGQQNPR